MANVRVRQAKVDGTNLSDVLVRATSRAKKLCQEYNTGVQNSARVRAPGPPPSQYPPKLRYLRTGYLRKSIKARKVKDGEWETKVHAKYGIYVELGTRYMEAMPYFRPAIEEQKAIFRAKYGNIFR